MKKLVAIVAALALSMTMFAGTALAANPSPNAKSPNAKSPNSTSPNTEAPADAVDAGNAGSDQGAAVNTVAVKGANANTSSSSAAEPKSPKTGVDLGTTAGMTATLLMGAGVATVVLRRKLND